ncbi:fungal-specific transcription factor domain-containing protein [Rhexocercosporidium sp. MPI-PUGE-AT-0058]|nr:fungal-specific transcription factor domain-containing protein [Rhexocercosporidium sp. MPI-PUGE-AT-0058]
MSSRVTTTGKPRQRSALACNSCRVKRVKCDSQRPACSSCLTNGGDCEYTHQGSNRKPPSKRYVEALQERIRNLESQLESLGQPVRRPESKYSEHLEGAHSDVDEDSLSDEAGSTRRSPMRDISDRLGDLNVGEDGQVHYFGSRSNFSLLKTGPATSSTISACELERHAACTLDQLGLRVEVSDELRDHLLDIFWTWQNTWQYIVIKEMFLDDLYGTKSGQYASHLLLSAVLALAARYSDRTELRTDPLDPNTAGNALAEQAKMILFYESQAPKVTTIQAAALLSLRETATNKEALGWMYCGIATRMAFNLGLHLDCSHWCETGRITKEAAELRGVVWWGCYVLDKLFNVGLGRPSTIQESEISARLPSTEQSVEFGPWTTTSSTGQRIEFPSSYVISNVRATVQLFNITAPTLDEIYRPSKRRLSPHVKDLLTKTHVALMEFQTNLPSCLRLSMSALRPTLPHSYLLHLQYHVAVILLHRPFIGVRRNSLGPGDLHSNADLIHLRECTKSAQSISTIFKLYQRHYTLRRIPISAVHCAFTASIILLLKATSLDSADRCHTISSLKILAEALTHMSVAWAWSQRALEAIRQLAREWLLAEDVMDVLGIGEIEAEKNTQENVPDGSQVSNIEYLEVPLWTAQDTQSADLAMSSNIDVTFWLNEEVDLQGWMDTFFTEPDLPEDFL